MPRSREIELKLDIGESDVARLVRSPLLRTPHRVRSSTQLLTSVYYDTGKQKLRRHGLTLRIRRNGRRIVQTIKRKSSSDATLMDRGEWEYTLFRNKPDLIAAGANHIAPFLDANLQADLKPLFETRVRRRIYTINSRSSTIELTIDCGEVVARGRTTPICEVELELKRGTVAGLFRFARELADQIPFHLSVTSKPERGYALINHETSTAVRAEAIVVPRGATCAAAFQIVARSCLHQVIANRPLVAVGNDEGIHQMRIGARRLRAAISMLSGMLVDQQSVAIQQRFEWLSRRLAPARELDVLIARGFPLAKADGQSHPAVARLLRNLRKQRGDAAVAAAAAINSSEYRILMLETAAWIEAGDWTRNKDALATALRQRSVTAAAAEEMERRYERIVKRGARLAKLDPTKRHRVRIDAKKFRYACEFFSSTFKGKEVARRRRKMVKALSRLQDALGELNDISAHETLMARYAAAIDSAGARQPHPALDAFVAGRLSGREEGRTTAMMKAAQHAHRALARTVRFWR